jgi:hypothetical protein
MKDNPFLQDVDDEPIVLAHSPAQFGGGTNQQVHGESHLNRQANPRGGPIPRAAVRHHHHQVHVRVLGRPSIGIRAKKDDLLRAEKPHDIACEPLDEPRIN